MAELDKRGNCRCNITVLHLLIELVGQDELELDQIFRLDERPRGRLSNLRVCNALQEKGDGVTAQARLLTQAVVNDCSLNSLNLGRHLVKLLLVGSS